MVIRKLYIIRFESEKITLQDGSIVVNAIYIGWSGVVLYSWLDVS